MTVPALLELQAISQWVLWRLEPRDGKPTKVPYDAKTGRRASVNEHATWSPYHVAAARAARPPQGLGFVVTQEDPYTGVDLDHCRDPETGTLDEEATAIVRWLHSYTEVTPSGTGVRVWVRATLPPGGRRHGRIEMYDRDRYFTMTGQHLEGTPITIEERSAELAALHARVFGPERPTPPNEASASTDPDDAALLARARNAANRVKFTTLWSGDTTAYASPSEADLALCHLLAFWTGRDSARMDRLFRQSGLMRPKWEARHFSDGTTYGQATIRAAIAQCHETYAPPRHGEPERGRTTDSSRWGVARSVADFLNEPEPAVDEIEPHQLARGSVTEWFSPRGLGKTMVAHALAVKHARAGLRVLLLDRDNARREVKRRLRGWGAEDAAGLKVMARDEVPPLTDRRAWARFPFQEYDVVIIDSIDASTEGVGEQDSAKPGLAIASVLDVARRAEGPAVLLLGNVVKSGAYGRGSGIVEDRADIVYEVRDATDFQPTGSRPWWLELPPAGREAWGERAARRRRRDLYRLAFVASKYRIGEEPVPFVLEVDLRGTPWTCRDVTADLEASGHAAHAASEAERQATREKATSAVLAEIARRTAAGAPGLGKKQAEALLMAHGLTSRAARDLLRRETRWGLRPDPTDERKIIVGLGPRPGVVEEAPASTDREILASRAGIGRSDAGAGPQSGRPHSTCQTPLQMRGSEPREMRTPDFRLPRDEDAEVEL
jgi:putative DNA primase/helicase